MRELAIQGHQVIVERNAAAGIGLSDDIYRAAGATVVRPVTEEHRWRLGRIRDPFGHHWEIGRPLIPWPPDCGQ